MATNQKSSNTSFQPDPGRHDGTAPHGAGIAVWWARIVGLVVLVIGLIIGGGGAWLMSIGGSWYYLFAGIGLVIAGALLMRGSETGIGVYALTLIGTFIWALWEVGFDGWALVPRLVAPTVLFLVVLSAWPGLGRRADERFYRSRPAFASILLLVMAGGLAVIGGHSGAFSHGIAAYAQDAVPSQGVERPSPSAPASSPADTASSAGSQGLAPPAKLQAGDDWPAYGGTDHAQRFSPLNQINASNASDLKQVWIAHTGDMPTGKEKGKYSPENTPIEVGGHLYVCSAMNIMISFNAATGKEEWRYDPKVSPDAIPYGATCRGVAYYAVPDASPDTACATRILEGTLDARLIAVDAKTGEPCTDFGQKGEVDLNQGIGETVPGWYSVTAPPTIVRGIAVVGAQVKDGQAEDAPSGVIRGYDAVTGKLAWAWDMGHPDWTGLPPDGEVYTRGTPNMWTTAAGDEELGYVYLPLGNSSVDYYGGNRKPFENEFSSSLVAIDVATGKPVWHFQTVHYDLWDYDLGSQPTLVDFPGKDGTVPAIILPSKQGQIYVLNRKTGEPLFPVEERPVPGGGVEPENLSKTQPYSGYAHLDQPKLTEKDMWGMSPIDQLWCRIQFHRANYGGEYTPPSVDKPFIEYPGYNGGSDWGSVAVDPENGILIANYNDMPNFNQLIPREKANEMGLKPIDEGGTPPSAEGAGDPQAGSPYAIHVNAGWRVPLTGMLCSEPPYGHIRAIDLKSGKTLWDEPLGSAVNNGPFGIPSMLPITIGTPNNGGPLVTAGGLIFIAATTDNKFRAIDIRTGKTVWQTDLPAGGQTTPMTYEVDGRQYVVLAPGGHHFMETKVGDQVIAYALPEAQ